MNRPLEKEFDYYLKHQDELVEKYAGKYIVIRNCEVQAVYDSEIEAIEETSKVFEIGTFLVQHCLPGDESVTQTFHSRVAFN